MHVCTREERSGQKIDIGILTKSNVINNNYTNYWKVLEEPT